MYTIKCKHNIAVICFVGVVLQSLDDYLTPKRLGHFFKDSILNRKFVHHKCDIFIWNWSKTMDV